VKILSVDQGTSGTKVLLIDGDGQILKRAIREVHVSYDQNGKAEADPIELWNSIRDAILEVSKGEKIDAIGVANQGESILAWDRENGEPLSKVIVWQDSRSLDICNSKREYREFVMDRTGLPIDPYFVAPKMSWLRENYDLKDAVITTTDTWFIFKLTGEFKTDPATASRTLLLDIHNSQWSSELSKIWNIKDTELPQLASNNEIAGTLTATELPELNGIPLVGLIVDQPAALIAEKCLTAGDTKCTFGTGAFLLVNIGTNSKISKSGLSTSIGWSEGGKVSYYWDGQVFAAASAVNWLVEMGFINDARELDSLPIDTEVISTSGFNGFGAPTWQARGTASFSGMTLATTKADLARAVIDGIAAQVGEVIESVRSDGISAKLMRVDGGLTQSKSLVQRTADLSQLDIEIYPHPDATAMGTFALTKSGLTGKTIAESISDWGSDLAVKPSWSKERTATYMARFRALRDGGVNRSG
jgi:glycerol kinase